MIAGEEPIHIFHSSQAARIYSSLTGGMAQGVIDLLKEMSSSVGVRIISDEESLLALLRAGAPIEDLLTLKTIQSFLKAVGETSKIHRVTAEDISERKVEKFSEITVNYYKEILKTGKNEVEDFSEFMNLFPLSYDLSSRFISHLDPSLKRFYEMFQKREAGPEINGIIIKRKFPDYWAECRWIARDVVSRMENVCIVAPDDLSIINVAKELELYSIRPAIVSPFPVFLLNDTPFNFVVSLIKCVTDNFTYESVMSLLESPFCDVDPSKIWDIRGKCYENNVTEGLSDWKTLFQDLKIESSILGDLKGLAMKNGTEGEIEELKRVLGKYAPNFTQISTILDLLDDWREGYDGDLTELYNDILSLKFWPKSISSGDDRVIIGKPQDIIGLKFDTVYLMSLDSASSLRAFSEDARDYLGKIGLEDQFTNYEDSVYRRITKSARNIVMTFSLLDDRMAYTESIPFYDSVQAEEIYVSRREVFGPVEAMARWEIASEARGGGKYILSPSLRETLTAKPLYPTFLENYIGCHFKGFVNGLLGIDEVDQPEEFLDPRTTGSMTHKILEKFYSTEISPREFSQLAEGFVKHEVDRERYESRISALKFYREKYLSNGKLTRFFVMDVNHAKELGRKTVRKEFRFPSGGKEVFYDLDSKKISIGGIVDRIDEQNGDLVVIDYKSSLYGYPKNELCDEEHGKVQLFFYKMGTENVFKKKVTAAAYVSFRDVSKGFSTAGFFHAIPNEEAELRKCKNIVDPAIESFLGGDFDPVVKEGGSLWACENNLFCPLLSVCRVQERRW